MEPTVNAFSFFLSKIDIQNSRACQIVRQKNGFSNKNYPMTNSSSITQKKLLDTRKLRNMEDFGETYMKMGKISHLN